jgi:hypothetical protein
LKVLYPSNDSLQTIAFSIGLKIATLKNHYGYYCISRLYNVLGDRNEKEQAVVGDRDPTKIWLKELGMYDKYAYQKVLPEAVYTWDKHSLAMLLSGLFITDGCVCQVSTSC